MEHMDCIAKAQIRELYRKMNQMNLHEPSRSVATELVVSFLPYLPVCTSLSRIRPSAIFALIILASKSR